MTVPPVISRNPSTISDDHGSSSCAVSSGDIVPSRICGGIGCVPHRLERIRGLYAAPGFCDEELIFFRVSDLRPPAPGSTHRHDEDDLARRLADDDPSAAESVREGLDETLTVLTLHLSDRLRRSEPPLSFNSRRDTVGFNLQLDF